MKLLQLYWEFAFATNAACNQAAHQGSGRRRPARQEAARGQTCWPGAARPAAQTAGSSPGPSDSWQRRSAEQQPGSTTFPMFTCQHRHVRHWTRGVQQGRHTCWLRPICALKAARSGSSAGCGPGGCMRMPPCCPVFPRSPDRDMDPACTMRAPSLLGCQPAAQ